MLRASMRTSPALGVASGPNAWDVALLPRRAQSTACPLMSALNTPPLSAREIRLRLATLPHL
jgi:hypothetical protein